MEEVLNWRMTKRYTFLYSHLFKLKQINQDSFMVHIPNAKRINLYDFHFAPINASLQFSKEMQAIDHLQVEGREFVFAGLKNGVLEGLQLRFQEGQQQGKMELRLQEEIGNDIYINDMVELGNGRLANCYNSGSIAIWDVSRLHNQAQPTTHIKKVHQDFVYKLRRVDRERIVSCGNDQYTNLIDIQTAQITDSYFHSGSVWCCYPVDQHCLVSAGLLGHLSFRDIRCGNVVQVLQLLTSETSFVTHLDAHSLVFGDRRQISRCDLRMLERKQHCQKGMKVSAESILVTPHGGVAVGRGGDMCLFENGGQEQQVQERNLRADNTFIQSLPNIPNFFAQFIAQFNNNNINQLHEVNLQHHDEDEEEQDEDELQAEEEDEEEDDSSEDDLM